MNRIRIVLAMVALLLGAGQAQAQGYVVVVSASNSVSALKKDRVNAIFLKRVTRWDDGTAVVPVNLQPSSPTRESFSRAVHGKSVSAIEANWQQQIFAGRDAPPTQRGSDAEVLAFIRANPGAIGYVSSGAALGDDVKAVAVN